jgi:PhzF family phenazine biosynthesis protein
VSSDLKIYRVCAFTANPDEGNPAGVVPQADDLDEGQMQAVAKAMGLSETAFVSAAHNPSCHFRLRWFTPTVEVRLCGHATVAALKVLTEQGVIPTNGQPVLIETLSGALHIRVERTDTDQLHWLEVPPPSFQKVDLDPDEVSQRFALDPHDLRVELPQVRDQVDRDLYIPVNAIDVLKRLQPNFSWMRTSTGWGAVCFFTQQTVESQNTWHCRFFAPAMGIDEDPVTGAINGPLGAYQRMYVQPADPDRVEYVGEQGDIIGRPGRVRVRVGAKGKQIFALEIGGQAVIVQQMSLSSVCGV